MRSAKIYPTSSADAALLVTGAYIPPAAAGAVGEDALASLRRDELAGHTQGVHSQVITGDFNVYTGSLGAK